MVWFASVKRLRGPGRNCSLQCQIGIGIAARRHRQIFRWNLGTSFTHAFVLVAEATLADAKTNERSREDSAPGNASPASAEIVGVQAMSGVPPISDIDRRAADVRYVPRPEVAGKLTADLL